MPNQPKNKPVGFTLLEILIALFIFTIVSMLLVGALHTVMNAETRVNQHALQLRDRQVALLLLSRDIEQAVNRPIVLRAGKQEGAFLGTPTSVTFTHFGLANPSGALLRSGLQRTRYRLKQQTLWRDTWQALDQAPDTNLLSRQLLTNVTALRFEYLDQGGRFHTVWPVADQPKEILPRAVRLSLSFLSSQTLSQLYVIAAENTENLTQTATPPVDAAEF